MSHVPTLIHSGDRGQGKTHPAKLPIATLRIGGEGEQSRHDKKMSYIPLSHVPMRGKKDKGGPSLITTPRVGRNKKREGKNDLFLDNIFVR
jgi:hypothetical protein